MKKDLKQQAIKHVYKHNSSDYCKHQNTMCIIF